MVARRVTTCWLRAAPGTERVSSRLLLQRGGHVVGGVLADWKALLGKQKAWRCFHLFLLLHVVIDYEYRLACRGHHWRRGRSCTHACSSRVHQHHMHSPYTDLQLRSCIGITPFPQGPQPRLLLLPYLPTYYTDISVPDASVCWRPAANPRHHLRRRKPFVQSASLIEQSEW